MAQAGGTQPENLSKIFSALNKLLVKKRKDLLIKGTSILEGCMKRYAILLLSGMFIFSFIILSGSVSFAKPKAAREDLIRNAYQQIRTATDKNGDGKVSMDECMAISRDKKKIAKDCKYWDADGNGFITEDEYVKQVLKIMQ
jgi:hypothetical protein